MEKYFVVCAQIKLFKHKKKGLKDNFAMWFLCTLLAIDNLDCVLNVYNWIYVENLYVYKTYTIYMHFLQSNGNCAKP